MRDNRDDAPITRKQGEDIKRLIIEKSDQSEGRIMNRLEDIENDVSELKDDMKQVKEDVDTLASVFGFRRDTDGKLKRT